MSGQRSVKTRLAALFALSLLLLPMITCTQPDPSPRTCAYWGGRYETYQMPDTDAVAGFCVFGDGTVCAGWQFREGACAPANPIGPLSPLAYPMREFPPLRSPSATPLPPLSPEEIVSKASLIFVGEVGEVRQWTEFAVYTQDGRLERNVTDAVGNPLPNIPVTDLLLKVETVIRDDGTIASGEPIVLRVIGSASSDTKNLARATDFPISFTGDRHLFLLTPNPDGQTYGLRFGPWSRLTIDGGGGVLHVSNRTREPFRLAGRDEPASLEEFAAFVETQPLPGQPPAGTMELPSVPNSPLAIPDVPASPLATPAASISPETALYVPIMMATTPLTAPSPMGTDSDGVVSGEWVNPFIDTYPIGSIDRPPLPPGSLDELVSRAPLIFIGTVGPVVRYINFCRTTEDGQLVENCPAADVSGNPAPGIPLTEFVLEPEIVIRDDGIIWRGDPIILRQTGRITETLIQISSGGAYPYNFTGDRFLFLLTPFPEDDVYGLVYGPWSRLIVDGNELRVSDGAQSPFQFGKSSRPITLDEFIQFVTGRQ